MSIPSIVIAIATCTTASGARINFNLATIGCFVFLLIVVVFEIIWIQLNGAIVVTFLLLAIFVVEIRCDIDWTA